MNTLTDDWLADQMDARVTRCTDGQCMSVDGQLSVWAEGRVCK